jgi:hypothetical protein
MSLTWRHLAGLRKRLHRRRWRHLYVFPAAQDALTVYARSGAGAELAASGLAFALVEDVDQVEGVDVARDVAVMFVSLVVGFRGEEGDVPEDCEADVDEDVHATACDY